MATKLFISPQQIQQTTIMGGNVDLDSFQFCIDSVQITVIEPLLGTELYDKIVTDYTADNLAGLYLELFTEFVQPITKYESTAQYINIAQYKLDNGGIFKHSPENAEVVSKEEVQSIASVYHNNAQVYVQRFNKWICKNTIAEYKRYQDEVNATNTQLVGGLYFGSRYNTKNDSDDFYYNR
jgi:hypothetical protein